MESLNLTLGVHDFLTALAWTQPRMLALFTALPLFNKQLVPRLLRTMVSLAIGLIVAPVLVQAKVHDIALPALIFLTVKEAFIGFVLGYLLAIPFWAFEAAGFFIDNQRGASIASTLNPLTGNDSSPLGILFNQAFIVYFLVSGGLAMVLGMLYDSYRLWPVFEWTPALREASMPFFISMLDQMVRLAVLYGAPVIVAMFLAELGLALVSRFVPQLQVFFLAMPIKSALALLVLVLYATTMFDMAHDSISDLKTTLPALQEQWGTKGARR